MVTLTCRQCRNQLSVPENKLGKSVFVCPRCAFPLEAPDDPAKAAPPPPRRRPSAQIDVSRPPKPEDPGNR